MISVQLDDRQLRNKITRIARNLDKASTKTAMDLAQTGKWMAKFLAPKFSGKTSDFIIARKLPGKGQAAVIAKNTTGSRFNLVRWMDRTNGYTQHPVYRGTDGNFYQNKRVNKRTRHIYSGDPRFMRTTARRLNSIKGNVAKANFNKINIGK